MGCKRKKTLGVIAFFYTAIRENNRISTSHISLYMALVYLWQQNGFPQPLSIYRRQVMAVAKISGRATYHKCLKELKEFGLIQYTPSFDPAIKSKIVLLQKGEIPFGKTTLP